MVVLLLHLLQNMDQQVRFNGQKKPLLVQWLTIMFLLEQLPFLLRSKSVTKDCI
jgi:hypothetical protein